MDFIYRYATPDGFDDLLVLSDGAALTGLCFEGSRRLGSVLPVADYGNDAPPVIQSTFRWLDVYFTGRQPDFTPVYRMCGATSFRKRVLDMVAAIPFGQTMSYGELSKCLKINSAQAVGGAVGWNPISIVVPCHRVVGANGNLVGYGGGVGNKVALLRLEGSGLW